VDRGTNETADGAHKAGDKAGEARSPYEQWTILAWLLWLPFSAWAAADLPSGQDLAADGQAARAGNRVLVVLFSRAGCPWCDRARQTALAALTTDDRVIVRQIDDDRKTALIDFAGRKTTHQAYARSQRVRLVPTVMFLSPTGEPLSEALVGFQGGSDFYGMHVERGIATALAQK